MDCKTILFLKYDYHTGITAEFPRSSQCGQLRSNIPSCHDLENRASETSKRSSGARISKDPITYRARKAIFNDLYLKKNAVYRH